MVQRTSSGVTGFGLGSAYGPYYHAWVLSSAPSDCLTKTGMKGGTNHRGPLHAVWQLAQVGAQPPKPDPDPDPGPGPQPADDLAFLQQLVLSMAPGTRKPETLVQRARDILTELKRS